VRRAFCGIHFFNPPRYMHLVEIIGTQSTDAGTLDALETWLTSRLGKGVIRALDTPNFVANRIGVFSILAVMHHTAAFGLGFDEVDALTGPKIGRPKSATYRTADVVGLDTLAHVVKTMQDTLPATRGTIFHHPGVVDRTDCARARSVRKPAAASSASRARKSRCLIWPSGITALPPGEIAEEVAAILKIKNPAEKFAALRASSQPQAKFLWAIFRDIFHYAAVQLENVADNARDLDFAMRWGFGWAQGPFETWQAAGWADIGTGHRRRYRRRQSDECTPLPGWVMESGRTVCIRRRVPTRPARMPMWRVRRCRFISASFSPSVCWVKPPDAGKIR
jgi:3-hydroxyacyl-CoA dehydrogenase